MKYGNILVALALSFLLGVQNGYIALWKDGSPDPVKVFAYRAEMLPEVDQKALEKGITIPSGSILARYLEDYLS